MHFSLDFPENHLHLLVSGNLAPRFYCFGEGSCRYAQFLIFKCLLWDIHLDQVLSICFVCSYEFKQLTHVIFVGISMHLLALRSFSLHRAHLISSLKYLLCICIVSCNFIVTSGDWRKTIRHWCQVGLPIAEQRMCTGCKKTMARSSHSGEVSSTLILNFKNM